MLVTLYDAMDGLNWRRNSNWLSDAPIGEWAGVGTDDTGRIKWLFLSDNQLTGEIPPELGNLTNLKRLGLSDNRLTGAIPPEIGNLSNLDWLAFADNRLSGAIPPQIGNLINLRWLYLDENQLTKIPPEIGNLSDLGNLRLQRKPVEWRDSAGDGQTSSI